MDANSFKTELPPYSTLAREHRLIERGLEVLRRFCDEVVRTKKLDVEVAREILHFLREFADRDHHLKEERVLFPAIESRSFFPGCGLVNEHEVGRTRVRNMAGAVEQWLAGDQAARQTFVQQARSYISLLRSHIAKEDECLANVTANSFPSATERERLAGEFDALERREMGERAFERYAALVETLEAWLPPDQ